MARPNLQTLRPIGQTPKISALSQSICLEDYITGNIIAWSAKLLQRNLNAAEHAVACNMEVQWASNFHMSKIQYEC